MEPANHIQGVRLLRKANSLRRLIGSAVASVAVAAAVLAGSALNDATAVADNHDGNLQEAVVTRVVDGDTLVANIDGADEKIRLIGVDTPESVHPDASRNTEEGKEASEHTKSVLPAGTHVWLESDTADADKYGRLLRYVWLEQPDNPNDAGEVKSKMLNAELIAEGWADPMPVKPNTKWESLFAQLDS